MPQQFRCVMICWLIPLLLLILTSTAHSRPWRRVEPVPASAITWKGHLGTVGGDKTRIFGLMARGFMPIFGLTGDPTAPGMERRIAQWLSSHPGARVVPVEAYPFFSKSVAYVYAWVVDGGENLNLTLVREGYCRADTMLPVLRTADLLISAEDLSSFRKNLAQAEKAAAAQDLGIWSRGPGGPPPGTLDPPGTGQSLARLEQEAASAEAASAKEPEPPPRYDRKSSEGKLVRLADGEDNAASFAALEELVRRADSGELSPSAHAELVRRGLERQANPKRRWRPHYGVLIEAAYAAGKLTREQHLRYARKAVIPRIKVVAVPFDHPSPARLFVETEQRVGHSRKPSIIKEDDGSRLLLTAGYHLTAVAVDGKPVGFERSRGGSGVAWQEKLRGGGMSGRGIGILPAEPLEPGLHDLTCTLRVQIFQGAGAWNAAQRARAPGKVSEPIVTLSFDFQDSFRTASGSGRKE